MSPWAIYIWLWSTRMLNRRYLINKASLVIPYALVIKAILWQCTLLFGLHLNVSDFMFLYTFLSIYILLLYIYATLSNLLLYGRIIRPLKASISDSYRCRRQSHELVKCIRLTVDNYACQCSLPRSLHRSINFFAFVF